MQQFDAHALKDNWNQALRRIQTKIRTDEFNSWIRPMEPLDAPDSGPGVVEVSVPNRLFASWVEENYLELLTTAWVEAGGQKTKFTFRWDKSPAQGELFRGLIERNDETKAREEARKKTKRPTKGASTLLDRYDLSSFVVGASNQFARAASVAVAGQPGTLYNPLFIYGGVGLGKTHLANAIGWEILKSSPDTQVLFLSAESFTNQLIDSIARNKSQVFKNRMRKVDVLILDDVQFLAKRERTQEEFFHVFNALYDGGKQIILTSDKFPNELQGVEQRLCNRFGWGLVADIQSPDMETRVAIIERKARDEGIELPIEVSSFIAEKIDSNIRDLEGALTRISAFASLNRREISLELAEELLVGVAADAPKPITLDEIQHGVATHFGLRTSDLSARRRTKKIAEARQVAMFIMRNHAGASYPAIGAHLGGRDHSTVIHACQAVERRRRDDVRFRHMLDTVTRMLGAA